MTDKALKDMIVKANKTFSDKWDDEVNLLKQYQEHLISADDLDNITVDLISLLRNYYIEHNSTFYSMDKFENKEYAEQLKSAVRGTLVVFDRFSVIRNNEQSEKFMVDVLTKLFENVILVSNPLFLQDCYPNIFSDISINDFADAYTQLVYNIVARLLGFDAIKHMITFNTGLGEKLTNTIYELIMRHYDSLKLNYLIRRVDTKII